MIKLPRIKRKWRILRNLVIVLLVIIVCLIVEDFASFTPKAAFKRLEKAYLSGPSDILVIRDEPNSSNTKIVLATYKDYIQVGTIYKNYHLWKGMNLFSYKSHGDLTVIPYNNLGLDNASIFVITNMKELMRAELTIKFEYTDQNEKNVTNIFTYEGVREADGIYYFYIENLNEKPKFSWEKDANLEDMIETLGRIADVRYNTDATYPIELRFYSETENIVLEEELEINMEYLYGK